MHTRARFIQEVMKQAWEIGPQTDQLLRNSLTALAADPNEKHSLLELEPFLTVPEFRPGCCKESRTRHCGASSPATRR